MWAVWWVWVAAGLLLATIEVVLPGYLFVGFAIGAVVTGVLLLLGLTVGLPVLLVIFALVSLVSWFTLRRLLGLRKGQVRLWHRDINDN